MAPTSWDSEPLGRISVATAVAVHPHDLPSPPRSWVERTCNVQHWIEMPRGGHFPPAEEPELLAEDIRRFFRPLRTHSRQMQSTGRARVAC